MPEGLLSRPFPEMYQRIYLYANYSFTKGKKDTKILQKRLLHLIRLIFPRGGI